MAIHIKEGESSYTELSKLYLKQDLSYTEICKVYVCTGPNQYELVFDTCETIPCDGSEDSSDCLDCQIRWSSFHDELLLSTSGPTSLGLTKLICPITLCASGGIDTSCTDDDICCKCGFDIYDKRVEPEVCQTIFNANCPCVKLDETSCSSLPKFINNTCKAYIWSALGGVLDETEESSCKSCIDSTRTLIGTCCKNGKRYSYIKQAIWNTDPTVESYCGIKRNCSNFDYFMYYDPTANYSDIIDYGYGILPPVESEGGVAESPGNDPTTSCPNTSNEFCQSSLSYCYPLCNQCANNNDTKTWCEKVCGTPIGTTCRGIWNTTGKNWNEYICTKCSAYPELNCCSKNQQDEGCDICVFNPCGPGCIVSCDGTIDWCSSYCKSNTPGDINWDCIWNSDGDSLLQASEVIRKLREWGCPCAPNFDTCNDICYDSFGTDDAA